MHCDLCFVNISSLYLLLENLIFFGLLLLPSLVKSAAIFGCRLNGVMTTLVLTKKGCKMSLFERNKLFSKAGSTTSKSVDGLLRHLQYDQFSNLGSMY